MRARRDALFLLIGSGTADLAVRFTQVALPLVVLRETGSVAATGLVGGAAGIPMLLSPWWARRARQWVDSGSRLAVVAAVQAMALAIVPVAVALGMLQAGVLICSGLLVGTADALSSPGRTALLADTGDRWGPDNAVMLLTWQDGIRRIGMLVGPPLGAAAVAIGLVNELLWMEAAAVLVAGLLAVRVVGERSAGSETVPSIRGSLKNRPDVLYGWIMRGTGALTWFAFTLGLSVIGAARGRPGVYLAAGMSGYGVGALVGTSVSLAVVRRVSPIPVAMVAWVCMGLAWIGMGVWTTLAAVAGFGALSGVTVVLGIAAISIVITRSSAGAERRALLSGQTVIVNAGSSAGLLIGGPVLAAVGAQHTLIWSGLLTCAVALGVPAVSRKRGTRAHRDEAGRGGERADGEEVGQDGERAVRDQLAGGDVSGVRKKGAAGESGHCETAGHGGHRDHDPCRAA